MKSIKSLGDVMPPQRRIVRTITTAPPVPGFVGEGHLAVEVVVPDDFVLKRLNLNAMKCFCYDCVKDYFRGKSGSANRAGA